MTDTYNTVTEGAATGKVFNLNLSTDLSSGSRFSIEFTKSNGDMLAAAATLGAVDLIDSADGTTVLALANQYLQYTWQDDDIPVGSAGPWRAYGVVYTGVDPNEVRNGANDSACFMVLNRNFCNNC